jgi:hypothetical protein
MDLDYVNTIRDFDHALVLAYNEDLESGECEVDVMGRSHDPTVGCANEAYDTYASELYCKAQLRRDLKWQKEEREWLPSMLNY